MATTFELDFRNKRYKDAAVGLRALSKQIGSSGDNFGNVVSIELKRFLKKSMDELAAVHSSPYPGGTTSKTLSRRSGSAYLAIRNSWSVREGSIDSLEGSISLPGRVAVHEKGATLTPKKGKYLTIPLPAALRSNGTPIKPRARDWKDTFVKESKKGNLLIFQKRGTNIVPLYVLKTQVKIPPRLGLQGHMEKRLPSFVDRAFEAMMDELLSEIGG